MQGATAWLAASALLIASPATAWTLRVDPALAEQPAATYEESLDVGLLTVVVRVVDTWGNPILGLQPDDFRVRVGPQGVPVVAVDWMGGGEEVGEGTVDAGAPGSPPAGPPAESAARGGTLAGGAAPATAGAPEAATAGRLVVVFVQADLDPTRIGGQLRLRPFTRELLASLQPRDRVAVVSFDSHLKLWQDFGADREATHRAIDVAMLFSPEVAVAPAAPPSLAGHLDLEAARLAASPERALELVARALEPLPGEKVILFLGWGMGRFDASGVRMAPAFQPAVRALRAAKAAVFVLDVTSADAHSLSAGLEDVAEATGGLYLSTFRLPSLATRTLARSLSGYYVLTLDLATLAATAGPLRVDLRRDIGTVLTRPLTLR